MNSCKKNKENCLSSFKSNPFEHVIEQNEFNVEIKEIENVEDENESNDNATLRRFKDVAEFHFYF